MAQATIKIKSNFTSAAINNMHLAGIEVIASPGSNEATFVEDKKENTFSLDTGSGKDKHLFIRIKNKKRETIGLTKHFKIELGSPQNAEYRLRITKRTVYWKITLLKPDDDGDPPQQTTNVTVSDDGSGG